MAKSDVEKYPTIYSNLSRFLEENNLEAHDADWSELPIYRDSEDGPYIRPFTVKTKCGQTVSLGLADTVPEYHN